MTKYKNYINKEKVVDSIFSYNTCPTCLSKGNLMHEYTGGDDYLVICCDCGHEFCFPEWYVMEEYPELEIFSDSELDELKKEFGKNFAQGDRVWISPSKCFGTVIGCYVERIWDNNQQITVLDLVYYIRFDEETPPESDSGAGDVRNYSIPIAISAECLKIV